MLNDSAAMNWLCANSLNQDEWPQPGETDLPTWEVFQQACSGSVVDREGASDSTLAPGPAGSMPSGSSAQTTTTPDEEESGQDLVLVPNVVGMNIDDAEQAIVSSKLRLNAILGTSGRVISQYPEAGMEVRIMSGVTLRAEN
jgi:hypothetical protein